MEADKLLEQMHVLERMKDVTRHCDTSGGRRESVAEHCWRVAVMAILMRDEFPDVDMNKVIRMCLLHDMGEAFTGDIPAFVKTDVDERRERSLLDDWICGLPEPYRAELRLLYEELEARDTAEARICHALDGLEAVIQHNESDLSSWSEIEYSLNLTYAADRTAFSPYLTELREAVRRETEGKLREGGKPVNATR